MEAAIDVVMLTKNSQHLLEKSLNSIYQNVPVNRLIIVDGFSIDGTLKIVEAFNQRYHNVSVMHVNGSRARAREKGIQAVTTEWFMFADSDVVLCNDWYRKAQKGIQPDVGAVWGVNIDVIHNLRDKRFMNLQQMVAKQCFALRGGTHDTLIRRDLVEDIKIPQQLHTYEDAYLMNWIKRKGYRAVVGEGLFCWHYKPPENWNLKNAIEGGILELKCGLIYSRNFIYMAYYPVFVFYWAMQIAFQDTKKLVPT
jgi:glycosyltransferase involved in cell wall biosynthesis